MHVFSTFSRHHKVFVLLTSVFITALVLAEATASKFFLAWKMPVTLHIFGQPFNEVIMTTGVIAFPITFIVTDLLNEYFGKKAIQFVTFLGMFMIIFEFVILQIGMALPTSSISPVSEQAFNSVFGATSRVIFGSILAYLIGQLIDITLFHWFKTKTNGKHLWLRATGSTFGSQFFDTFIVLTVAFIGTLSLQTIIAITLFNYAYKLLIAVAITPVIYGVHKGLDNYLNTSSVKI